MSRLLWLPLDRDCEAQMLVCSGKQGRDPLPLKHPEP